jgi:hypothetical protein
MNNYIRPEFQGIVIGSKVLLTRIKEGTPYSKEINTLMIGKDKLPRLCPVVSLNSSKEPCINITPNSEVVESYYLGFFEFKKVTFELKYLL